MEYTRKQLILAQKKYNENYVLEPELFKEEIKADLDTAIEQIDYLLSLVKTK